MEAMAQSVDTEMKQFTAVTNGFAGYLLQLIQELKTNSDLECFSHDIMKISQQHQRNRLKVSLIKMMIRADHLFYILR